jgi:hypothetical protein
VVLRLTCRSDLPFLQQLWNDGEVMRYVGYPQNRFWSEETAAKHQGWALVKEELPAQG